MKSQVSAAGARTITAVYRVTDAADRIQARADAIAVEQSVEMPVAAISDRIVLDEIVGRVEDIRDLGTGSFEIRIGLAVATTGLEAGQLMNMLFGNSSIHADVTLVDAIFPETVLTAFHTPRPGLQGWRRRADAKNRALTCSALKPQGLPAPALADIAGQLARGGLDFIKDDHGLADQVYSPF
ncbi:MAG TPA: ribulose 1,5-bisphosphate carboxylase, partial [Rhizomicrobium sp.]|nr:ribulose 1,5-bisphosphate carboxylase [Rhizomicrobium sp.]